MSAELVQEFGEEAEIELIAGGGGIFEVKKDGSMVFEKMHSGHFPNDGEVLGILKG